jgi:penicillin-binding protein 1B
LSRLVEPRLLIVFGVLALAASVVAAHYYVRLSAEIDARLSGNFFDDSVGIFTTPFKVSAGDRLSVSELTSYLQAAGYKQASTVTEGSGAFSVAGNAVEVAPDARAMLHLGIRPVRIEIDNNNRVESLADLRSGRSVDAALIEGELLASVRDGDRRKKMNVSFSEIPEPLRNAILAIEDRRFFTHSGIDWRGIARAFWADLNEGHIVQGGSTITQQLIKNSFLSSTRSFSRKLKEAAMAVILESRLSKEEIFTLYCNDVYLGQSGTFAIHGVAEAAQVMFGKQLTELTLSESAFLAGMVHAPNRYSSRRDTSRSIERRNLVLAAMVETEAISAAEAESAEREPLLFKMDEVENDYGTRYFIDYVQRFMEQRYADDALASQQRIQTSMDPRLQRAAHEAVIRHTERLDKLFARSAKKGDAARQVQASLVALDAHTGEVLAMVGGRNYDESQLNRATDARRQPGSTFKPFVYASALGMRSYTAATLISDRPQTFSYDGGKAEYNPSDYRGGFTNRDVTLREAFASSMNVPAVELASRVGFSNIAELAQECGLPRPHAYPSMALGTSEVTPLELAGAYTPFVNQGMALRPIPVKGVESRDGRQNAARVAATGVKVFSPQVAYLMTDFMRSVVDAGTAARLRAMGVKGAIAGKTGTSNDGWFAGYTPNLVCVVWVGFDDNTDLRMKASESALPIWADFMREALDMRPGLGGDHFQKPSGIIVAAIDPTTGHLATPHCPEQRQETFIAGTEPFANCIHESAGESEMLAEVDETMLTDSEEQPGDYDMISLDICRETGLLASYNCPRVKKSFQIGKDPLEICRLELHRKRAEDTEADEGGSSTEAGAKSEKRRLEPLYPPPARAPARKPPHQERW